MFVLSLNQNKGLTSLLQDEKYETSTKFDHKEKANIFQKQISSVFTKETNVEVPVLDKKTEVNIPNINISEEMGKYIFLF